MKFIILSFGSKIQEKSISNHKKREFKNSA
jgi:hypothetical protein